MKKRKIMTFICAVTLAASLIAGDILPAFAAGAAVDGTVVIEENADFTITEETAAADGIPVVEENTDLVLTEKAQATASDGQEKDDGLLRVAGMIYNGYYMDNAGIMYVVSAGVAKPATKLLGRKAVYYSEAEKMLKTLPKKTLFVAGRVYTGYYMDSKDKMYHVKKGTCALQTGTVKKGTKYYSQKQGRERKLSRQTLYVNGNVYTGYYMDNKSKMYRVKKGKCVLKTGTVKEGTKYYSQKAGKSRKLKKQTLYVKGKVYTGYYMDNKNKMCHVEKGTCTLQTGMLDAGTKYYSYKAKKNRKLLKQTLYVEGTAYNGYYLGSDNRMYLFSGGTYTPVDTVLNVGTSYYSQNDNAMLTLPFDKVYMDGKAIEGLTPSGIAAFQKARSVVQTVSNPADSKADKLYKCYLWISKCPYVQYRTMMAAITADPVDWDSTFANDIFDKNSGCCASLACAFAYMAKACGYEQVTICSDSKHAWVDIEGRLYDPLFAKDRNFSLNYNAAYTDYRVNAAFTRAL